MKIYYDEITLYRQLFSFKAHQFVFLCFKGHPFTMTHLIMIILLLDLRYPFQQRQLFQATPWLMSFLILSDLQNLIYFVLLSLFFYRIVKSVCSFLLQPLIFISFIFLTGFLTFISLLSTEVLTLFAHALTFVTEHAFTI